MVAGEGGACGLPEVRPPLLTAHMKTLLVKRERLRDIERERARESVI